MVVEEIKLHTTIFLWFLIINVHKGFLCVGTQTMLYII